MPNLKKLDNLIDDLEKQAEELGDFASVHSEISDIKVSISENLTSLKSGNKELSEISTGIKNNVEDLESKVNNLLKEVESKILNKIQIIEDDNKKFYKDIDSSIVTRLDKHKSDIQIDIRRESKDTIEVIESNLKSVVQERMELQDQKLELIKNVTLAVVAGIVFLIWKTLE